MKLGHTIFLVCGAALALSACGSTSSGSISPADTAAAPTTLDADESTSSTAAPGRDFEQYVTALGRDEGSLEVFEECLAEDSFAAISDEGYQLTLDDAPLELFSSPDFAVMSAAFGVCVPHETLVDELAEGIGQGLGFDGAVVNDGERSCAAAALETLYVDTGTMMQAIYEAPSDEEAVRSLGAIVDCLGDETANAWLLEAFEVQGATEDQARCVIAGVAAQYSSMELVSALVFSDFNANAATQEASLAC